MAIFRSDGLVKDAVQFLENPEPLSIEEDLGGMPVRRVSTAAIVGGRQVSCTETYSDTWGGETGSRNLRFCELPLQTRARLFNDETLGKYWLAVTPYQQWLGITIPATPQPGVVVPDRPVSVLPSAGSQFSRDPSKPRPHKLDRALYAGRRRWWPMYEAVDLTSVLAGFNALGVLGDKV